jgi:class 3 adenylate cyclase
MSLRYRLFLWVSGLFLVVSVCSYFVENYVASTQLKRAQQALREKILKMSEERRVELQDFLASAIAEEEVKIDAILNNLSTFSPLVMRFGPTLNNEKLGTWGEASDVLLEYKWLDFIQNTNQAVTTAGFMPSPSAMGTFYRSAIDEDLSWIYDGNFEGQPTPYLGVRLPYSLIRGSSLDVAAEVLEHVPGMVPDLYCLFDVEQVVNASARIFETGNTKGISPVRIQWTEGYELDLDLFVKAFQRARELLLTKKIQPPQATSNELKQSFEKATSMQDGRLNPIPTQNLLASVSNEQLMKKRFEDIALRYTQINVTWILVALFDSGVFGDKLFSYPFPGAITVFGSSNAAGVGIGTSQVLFDQQVFDDAAYYQQNKGVHSNLGTSLAVIPFAEKKRVFFGNVAEFAIEAADQVRKGYLTLGVDVDTLLQRLVLAIRQKVILIHGGQPLSAYSDSGEKMAVDGDMGLPIDKLLGERLGVVTWGKENDFFMHIQPFPHVDLHFLVFNPESKEFAFLHDLEAGSQEIIDSIRLNTHIEGLIALFIAILLLHNISRRITRPIIQLARATGAIAEGQLDQTRLSLPVSKHNDEIAVLCHSFEEMVKGLQEKEKVKGVLNKVVSREIAQEILKGSIHLGGEEKIVTVLFADIRNFTGITQNMPPQKVIDLLNTCMTKVSLAVDRNKGVIDKYVGDEVMALFGAPIAQGEDAVCAIKSALEMIEVMKEWNRERAHLGEPAIELGIGIHTGPMLAGNMGAENRLNYTVIGSNVNLAARLCQVAKGMEILMTKDTLDQPFIKERIAYEELSPLQLRGFDKAVSVFCVLHIRQT